MANKLHFVSQENANQRDRMSWSLDETSDTMDDFDTFSNFITANND